MRILLVDDNLPDRVRYRRMLQKAADNLEIVEAEDGAGGLQQLATQNIDCVLLDQELPDMQGLDVLEDICEKSDAPPVIMLTGEEDAAVSIEALRRGAADYLMKRRIDDDRLLRAIRGAIDRRGLQQQLHEQQLRLARFYRLANQTEDALFIVDGGSGRIPECNEAARERLGMRPLEGGGVSPPAAFTSSESWLEFCRQALSGGSARLEWRIPQPDARDAVIEILARSIAEDGRSYIVAVGRDISLQKQRERELLERSLRDGLTGLWNRRAFEERLAESWHASQRNQQPLSLVLIDVDHFKIYNDRLGHTAGDDCLRSVAQSLRGGVLRAGSMVARFGGEEFVALLEGTPGDGALAAAERLRQCVQALALPHPGSSAAPYVTVSLGVACLTPGADSLAGSLIQAADAALYRAKQGGRNRVEFAGPIAAGR